MSHLIFYDMCYIASTIAGYFIDKSNKGESPLSVFQLIKLAYIAHGWNLALNNEPLISDKIEAWEYGPVMPSLHHFFQYQGLKKDDLVDDSFSIEEVNCIKPHHRILLNKVYVRYKHFSAEELSKLMHEKDTPWYSVWNDGKGKKHIIENEKTKLYYSLQINKKEFNSYPEYSPINTKEDAINFLKNADILMEDGNINPIYKNS